MTQWQVSEAKRDIVPEVASAATKVPELVSAIWNRCSIGIRFRGQKRHSTSISFRGQCQT